MANLRDIRRRIASVTSTQKITRAMKMVAAAKLRRAQETLVRARPYALQMRDLVNNLALRADPLAHPLLRHGAGKKVALIVVTSDRGLCGGFNSNIVNEAMRTRETQFKNREIEVSIIGRKGIEALRRRKWATRATYANVLDDSALTVAGQIVDEAVADFAKGETDGLYCVYNEFKSAIAQKVTVERLLPFEPAESGGVLAADYEYEPSESAVLDVLLRLDLQVQMHRILYESHASECGARMTAMDSATKNAGDVIDRLTLTYNRARQSAITTEMIEIISGAEAL